MSSLFNQIASYGRNTATNSQSSPLAVLTSELFSRGERSPLNGPRFSAHYRSSAPVDHAGNSLTTARDIGQLTTAQTLTDYVDGVNSNIDPSDYYRFTLNTDSVVNFSASGVTGNVSAELIQYTDSGQDIGFSSGARLKAGTYFVRVYQDAIFGPTSGTNYSLTLSATPFQPPVDHAGNSLTTARDIGQLTTAQTLTDSIDSVNSNIDPSDYYRFTLNTDSVVNFSASGVTGNVSAALIQHTDSGQNISFSSGARLTAGTYFIRVYQDAMFGSTSATNYALTLSATPFQASVDRVGNSLTTARSIGRLAAPRILTDSIDSVNSNIDPSDYYRFTLNTDSVVNFSASGVTGNVSAALIHHTDSGQDSYFSSGARLTAGTYFVRVYQDAIFGPTSGTNYSLTLSATPFQASVDHAGNSLTTARDIGQLTTAQTLTDSIDSVNSNIDPSDYYRFTLNTDSVVNFSASGVTGNVSAALIQHTDSGQDSYFSSGARLTAGTYFVRVYQDAIFGPTSGTNYSLTLSATPFQASVDHAGNSLTTARDIGQLTTAQTLTDSIDSVNSNIDPSDYYRFTL